MFNDFSTGADELSLLLRPFGFFSCFGWGCCVNAADGSENAGGIFVSVSATFVGGFVKSSDSGLFVFVDSDGFVGDSSEGFDGGSEGGCNPSKPFESFLLVSFTFETTFGAVGGVNRGGKGVVVGFGVGFGPPSSCGSSGSSPLFFATGFGGLSSPAGLSSLGGPKMGTDGRPVSDLPSFSVPKGLRDGLVGVRRASKSLVDFFPSPPLPIFGKWSRRPKVMTTAIVNAIQSNNKRLAILAFTVLNPMLEGRFLPHGRHAAPFEKSAKREPFLETSLPIGGG